MIDIPCSGHNVYLEECEVCEKIKKKNKKKRNYFEILVDCISGLASVICFKFGM